ncbi:nucleotide sugar dehydrogenase [Halomicrobium sp. IBSBa]|uniref:nucleotide sugar dehydrogenase n=1 Tax=Halomicrobium sp. IBSBa TaxID=2778916 RepID=UPI001ABF2888|nr:nucleotide sugar dehydrogenase [Halomicrobium sp. IBSBa]MBO4248898.1 nucleotide sugar dehydrogenase [Halomicrobium sp. IBSBa]
MDKHRNEAPYVQDGNRTGDAIDSVNIGVYGLGKMGLPVAAVFADTFGGVRGADIDEAVVDAINRGRSPVQNEPGLPELVSDCVDSGELTAVVDPNAVASWASLHIVIVPTLLDSDDNPDLSIVNSVVDDIADGLTEGDMVIVESTVPPGTCRDQIYPKLVEQSGLEPGTFGLAFCPERTASGSALEDIRRSYPKVVGGIDEASTRTATRIYEQINENDVIAVSDATTAEATKIYEGLFRDVNIALANEIAKLSTDIGIDATEAIDAANSVSFINIHEPGPGVGGHCIPYYPYFVMKPYDTDTELIQTARTVNDEMPVYTVDALQQNLEATGTLLEDATVVILGLTYRPEVRESRASPAIGISHLLAERGASVRLVDPLLSDTSSFSGDPMSVSEFSDAEPDAVVVVTPHAVFETIDWDDFPPMVIVDGRDAIEPETEKHRLYTIGKGVETTGIAGADDDGHDRK